MIELNCTYEESKKILELGYDFSKICWFFRKETPSFKMNLIKIDNDFLTYATPEGENFGDHIDCVYSSVKETMQAGYTPIIPKAALEACLPELSGSTWLKNLKTNWVILDLDPHIVKLESIFKAFMWCHENYPEELKKKFEEVMR